ELFPPGSKRERKAVHRFGLLGKVAELATGFAVERESGRSEALRAPLKRGMPGVLWRTAKACGAAGLALSLLPGGQRWKQVTASVLTLAGALATRYAIYEAGKESA